MSARELFLPGTTASTTVVSIWPRAPSSISTPTRNEELARRPSPSAGRDRPPTRIAGRTAPSSRAGARWSRDIRTERRRLPRECRDAVGSFSSASTPRHRRRGGGDSPSRRRPRVRSDAHRRRSQSDVAPARPRRAHSTIPSPPRRGRHPRPANTSSRRRRNSG